MMHSYTVTDLGIDADRSVRQPHGSNSQRVSYEICPAQYGFARIEKMPGAPTSDMLRGTVLHDGIAGALIATIAGKERDIALAEGRVAIKKAVAREIEATKEHGVLWMPHFTDGPRATWLTIESDATDALPLLYDVLLARFVPLSVEHGFLVTFPDLEPTAAFGDFIGMDRENNEIVVVDTKTGAKKKSLSDLVSDDAMLLYGAGAEHALAERPQRLTYACVVFSHTKKEGFRIRVELLENDDGQLGIVYDPRRLKRVETHQRALAQAKEKELFLPLQVSWACERCPYFIPCEERYGPTGLRFKAVHARGD